jgi:hypothetical protein
MCRANAFLFVMASDLQGGTDVPRREQLQDPVDDPVHAVLLQPAQDVQPDGRPLPPHPAPGLVLVLVPVPVLAPVPVLVLVLVPVL